jgi:tetratricopeptide (TPR) repeat protein
VVAGQRTWRLIGHGVVRGAGPDAVERVLPDAEAVARRLETPLVGRANELGELFAAFQLATTNGHARLVSVLGSPGVGKTRLAREFVDVLSGTATCLVGRTPSYGDAATYAPLRDALSTLAHGSIGPWASSVVAGELDAEPVALRVAAAVGEASFSAPVEETAWAVRRLLETLARRRPVVLVLEDLHDAAPAFLDLVEHIATLARAPIVLLVLARTELLDNRPDWGGGGIRAASILLDALPSERARDLLDNLAGSTSLAPGRRETILEAAAGNALFIEQLLASAGEDGDPAVPDSIHALLAARLDRLDEDDRRVLQAAAVCGLTFPTDLVQALADNDARRSLLALTRRDLVEPDASDPVGREAWGFRHALVRDEAYATLPKRRRARLHEQVADLVAADADERSVDASEVIGYHLESAYLALLDVEPDAPELERLATGAGRHLTAAGRRAHDEGDMATAAGLLGRAFSVLPPTATERLELAIRLASALDWIDRWEEGLSILEEAGRGVPPDDQRGQARLLVARHAMHLSAPEPEDPAVVLADARRAIEVLEKAGDDAGLAVARILESEAAIRASVAHDPVRELALAVEHARAAGERYVEGVAAGWLCIMLRRGPLPVDEAEQLIAEVLANPPTEYARAAALGGLADLRAMAGAFDEARTLVAENHAILEELGMPQAEASDLIAVADVEILAGELRAAEQLLREAVDRLAARNDRFASANAAWRLALVLVRQGRADEAEPLLAESGEASDFVRVWRMVLGATLAARRGQPDRATTLLEEADRELGERLGGGGMHVDLLLQAAEVEALLGRPDAAVARLRKAATLAEWLGYAVAVHNANERLAELEARL